MKKITLLLLLISALLSAQENKNTKYFNYVLENGVESNWIYRESFFISTYHGITEKITFKSKKKLMILTKVGNTFNGSNKSNIPYKIINCVDSNGKPYIIQYFGKDDNSARIIFNDTIYLEFFRKDY